MERVSKRKACFLQMIERKKWKSWEIKIIKNNYKKLTDIEINEKYLPHRTESAIRTRRHLLKLRKDMQKHQLWTEEEIKTLKENYLDYDQRELRDKFFPDKTVEQVRSAKMSRGLKKPRVWTEEEVDLLVLHGANHTHTEMHKKFLPNKTPEKISSMRRYYNIRRTPNVAKKTHEDPSLN